MSDDDKIKQLVSAVSSGAAVCLTGAGFSRLAKDAYGSPVPSTDELTAEIKSVLDIDPSEQASLAEIADFAQERSEDARLLKQLLMKRLTVTEASTEQAILARLPWRAIFTTNFDDVLEQAREPGSFVAVTPAANALSVPSDRTPIYYMHGRARDLLETDADPGIVISERNYLQLDSRNRDLYAKFSNEVFAARAVVIVGYSIRDLEIAQGLLSRSSALKEKTFVVCHADDGRFAIARLSKFGTVLPIGVEGLSELLKEVSSKPCHDVRSFQFLEEVTVPPSSVEVTSDDFVRLILRGDLELAKYRRQLSDAGSDRFSVDRSTAANIVLDGSDALMRRFVVSSDFGNGKTVFLKQLALKAIERGYRVLVVKTQLDEAFQEVDAAVASGQRFMFIMDDVVRYREIAKYVGARLTNNIALVCTTRGEHDDRAYGELAEQLGGAVRSIDLNKLTATEVTEWNDLLERWGFWEQRIGDRVEDRRRFLLDDCGSENRSIVLALFKESKIAERIDRIVEFFLRHTRVHLRAFAALLIASLAQRHVSWESIVSWLEIDELALRKDLSQSEISDLFQGGRSWNALTSSQLAEYILRTRFLTNDRDILVDVYTTIVLRTAASANDERSGIDARENMKELMKFRFLTRLFGDEQDAVVLIGTVYKKLSVAPRIRDNPQFWLQFAMSRMDVDDLETAETYLNTALGLARERGMSYSPFQILDQRARLYLRKNTKRDSYSKSEVMSAIGDLSDLLADSSFELIYVFRASPLISDFLERHIDTITSDVRSRIEMLLNDLKSASADFAKLPRSQKGETRKLYQAMNDSLLVLRNA